MGSVHLEQATMCIGKCAQRTFANKFRIEYFGHAHICSFGHCNTQIAQSASDR
jgi:hypothetical protein